MIIYVYDDLFYSPARTLVNPVNTFGTMGGGLSYDFKRFFPEMYEAYREACQGDAFSLGQLMLYQTSHKWVLNFPTKRHYRATAALEHIDMGLQKFASIYAGANITSVSFPMLGADEDGLDWDDVRPRMEAYLRPLPLMIYIHLGEREENPLPNAVESRSTRAMRSWLNTLPRVISFAQFWRDLAKVARIRDNWQTVTHHEFFRVLVTEAKGRQRRSVKLSPRRGESIFLPETQLRDLWQYIQRAGYILPQNLPAGLDEHADYLVTLLAELPYFRLVYLAPVDDTPVIGLHYIPPPMNADDIQQGELQPER
ncbi:MAG: macro domain-containing protein [Anaerolineae bacterium]|nr:macro domain-containing protein [Anaerolineae bacterium]